MSVMICERHTATRKATLSWFEQSRAARQEETSKSSEWIDGCSEGELAEVALTNGGCYMEQGEMQADDALWRPSTWSTDAVPHLQYISMLLGLVLKGRGCFLPLLEVVIKFF